jgi:hypothetical protein
MNDKWQIIVAECEKISEQTGVRVLPIQPPADGEPVGAEWANLWQREARHLDWMAGFLRRVSGALEKEETSRAEAKEEKKTGK